MCDFICEFPPQYSSSSQSGLTSSTKKNSGVVGGLSEAINATVVETVDLFSTNIENSNSLTTAVVITNALQVNEIGGFTATGTIDFSGQVMLNVNIDSGTIDGTIIGGSNPSDGYFSYLYADDVDLFGGNIDNISIGVTTPSTGNFTTVNVDDLNVDNVNVTGGYINNTAIGISGPSSGDFTTITATNNVTFYGVSGNPCFEWDYLTSKLTLCGDLEVNGTTTTLNTETVTIDDVIISLADYNQTSNDSKDRGIEFKYYDTSLKLGFFGYNNDNSRFTYYLDAINTSEVITGTLGDAEFKCLYLNGSYNSICSDGTNITIGSTSGNILLNTSNQIEIPENTELLFGVSGTIVGSNGDLQIGTTGLSVTIPINTDLVFGVSGYNIIGDGNSIYIQSTNDIVLNTGVGNAVTLQDNTELQFGPDGKKIYSDGDDLYIVSDRKIIFQAIGFEGLPGITGGTTGGIQVVDCIEFVNENHTICGDGDNILLSTTGSFNLEVEENIFIEGDTKLMFGTTGNYIYSDLTDLILSSENDIILGTSGGNIIFNGNIELPEYTNVSLWIDYKKFDHDGSIWTSTREVVSGNHYYYWYNNEQSTDITYINKDISHDLKGYLTKGFNLTRIYFSYEVLVTGLTSITATVVKKTINPTTGVITFTSLTTNTSDLNAKTTVNTHYGYVDISTTYLDEHESISVELEINKQTTSEIKFNGVNLVFNEKV